MASGSTLLYFGPQCSTPPSSNYATFDTRNAHLVLEFDASTAETIYFEAILPRSYSGGGLTASIAWMADGATTGNCVWGLSIERHQDDADDLDSDSFATEQTATGTTASADGEVQYTEIAFTSGAQMDSLAVGEHFRLALRRVATDGSDTLSVDAQFLGLELRET